MKTLICFVTLLTLPLPSYAQGPLTAPGAPAPTMKTLQQIEPRTDLASVPGDATFHHIITQPGSYYLSGNLPVTKGNGIDVRVARVTIDLNGFEVRWLEGTGGAGIFVRPGAHEFAVKNGAINGKTGAVNGFAFGIQSSTGTDLARAGSVVDVTVSGCSNIGIRGGPEWQLLRVRARGNGQGLQALDGAVVAHCIATENSGTGIAVEKASVSHCVASSNGGVGIVATSSTISGCTVRSNGGDGISAGISHITGCTAYENSGDGIQIASDCFVKDNNCDSNGAEESDGAGIFVNGTDNRIEANNATDNDRGIDAPAGGNVIIKNSASGNTGTGIPSANYDVAASNFLGTIVTTAAAMNDAVNSNINMSF